MSKHVVYIVERQLSANVCDIDLAVVPKDTIQHIYMQIVIMYNYYVHVYTCEWYDALTNQIACYHELSLDDDSNDIWPAHGGLWMIPFKTCGISALQALEEAVQRSTHHQGPR